MDEDAIVLQASSSPEPGWEPLLSSAVPFPSEPAHRILGERTRPVMG